MPETSLKMPEKGVTAMSLVSCVCAGGLGGRIGLDLNGYNGE